MVGEGYVVIRDALRKTGKVGLAQLTIAGREWLVAVAPLEDGLMMEMMRYADELRDPADYFDEVPSTKPDKVIVDLAVQLIEKKSSAFDTKKFEDHNAAALRELVDARVTISSLIMRSALRAAMSSTSWKRSRGVSVSRRQRSRRLGAAGRSERNCLGCRNSRG
jgi:Ku protein